MAKTCSKCGKKQGFEQWAHFKEDGEKTSLCPSCYRKYLNKKFPGLEVFAIKQFRKKFLINDVNNHIRLKTKGKINSHNAHVFLKNLKNSLENRKKGLINLEENTYESSSNETIVVKNSNIGEIETKISEKEIGLARKIVGGVFVFILILWTLYIQYGVKPSSYSLSIPGISTLIADIFWVAIFVLIIWALLDNKVGLGIQVGFAVGFIYGGCLSLYLPAIVNSTYMPSILFFNFLIIGPLYGILFGITYASTYNLLPGNTRTKKLFVLGIIFWLFFNVLIGSHYITKYSFVDYIINWIIIGFISFLLLLYFFGFLWKRGVEEKRILIEGTFSEKLKNEDVTDSKRINKIKKSKFCSKCRNKIENNPNFCPECGAKLV